MNAHRAPGQVTRDACHVAASVFFAIGFTAVAVQSGMPRLRYSRDVMAALLALAIVSLHFTGMTAFQVVLDPAVVALSDTAGLHTLAITVFGLSSVIVAGGHVSYLRQSTGHT